MKSLCGTDCSSCYLKEKCKGCTNTCGSPFGGKCIAAECIKNGGIERFTEYKKNAINEINNLNINGLPKINELYSLCGSFVNLEYALENYTSIKLLKDEDIYLGTQVLSLDSNDNKCFGIVVTFDYIIISKYKENGLDPELVLYKKR